MEEEIIRLNRFFDGGQDGVCLARAFVHHARLDNGIYAEGEIILEWKGELYPFRVQVPTNFPLSGLRFFYLGETIARHLLRGGLVCAQSFFTDNFDQKLRADLQAIQEWIDEYLTEAHKSHYEYLPLPSLPYFLIFDEEVREELPKFGEAGEFILTPVPGQRSLFGSLDYSFFADGLGGHVANWSRHYKEQNSVLAMNWLEKHVLAQVLVGRFTWAQYHAIANFKQTQVWPKSVEQLDLDDHEKQTLATLFKNPKGLYVYLGIEPITVEKQLLTHLDQLWDMLPTSSKTYLESRIFDEELMWSVFGHIPLAVGYQIPNLNEIHWEWILLKWMEEPSEFWKQPILWGKSVNASSSRFFGRGELHGSIRTAKVLLLGCGAMGSSLAETLTRGGLRDITLADPQMIEAGNICRSTYSFTDIHTNKVNGLARKLTMISPFLHVTTIPEGLGPVFRHQRQFEESRDALQPYDLIFDCTADDSVAWMLDQLQLDATVINLSITNKAQHFIAIANTGGESVLFRKRGILQALGQGESKPTFYEGAGCWHPTFEAAYADINLLLQHYIADANHRLMMGRGWTTTVLETVKGDFGLRVKKREDV